MKKVKADITKDTVSIFKNTSNHKYFLIPTENPDEKIDNYSDLSQVIKFQEGPINEVGINGITEASLISVLIDRFEYFQKNTKLPCDENETILDNLYHSLFMINKRTEDRIQKNIEGYNK